MESIAARAWSVCPPLPESHLSTGAACCRLHATSCSNDMHWHIWKSSSQHIDPWQAWGLEHLLSVMAPFNVPFNEDEWSPVVWENPCPRHFISFFPPVVLQDAVGCVSLSLPLFSRPVFFHQLQSGKSAIHQRIARHFPTIWRVHLWCC